VKVLLAGLAVLLLTLAACKPGALTSPSAPPPTSAPPTPKPTPTLPPVTAGGTVAMGRTVITHTGSRVTVISWHRYADRSIPNGPGQVYETLNVSFCAGPRVQETTQDLAPFFELELYDGERIVPDSQSQPGEFRSKGRIDPGQCVSGPLVFQVEGGSKPHYALFTSPPTTTWIVP
jgi:hypothetical protein